MSNRIMEITILTLFLILLFSFTGLCEEKIELVELNADNYQEEVLECDTPVMIYFWAVWCKYCKPMSLVIENLAVFYENKVKFVKVDVNHHTKFLNNFRPLRGLPLVIFYKDGKEVDRILGFTPFTTISSKLIILLKEEKKEKKDKKYNCDGGICDPPEE